MSPLFIELFSICNLNLAPSALCVGIFPRSCDEINLTYMGGTGDPSNFPAKTKAFVIIIIKTLCRIRKVNFKFGKNEKIYAKGGGGSGQGKFQGLYYLTPCRRITLTGYRSSRA